MTAPQPRDCSAAEVLLKASRSAVAHPAQSTCKVPWGT